MPEPREEEPTSGTFVAPQFVQATHGPEFGSGGFSGRAKIIGNTTWMMLGIGLVCFMVYVSTQFIREDRADLRRVQQLQIESLEKRIDHCERRHQERDNEEQRDRNRQHEDRQAAARERQQAIDQFKLLDGRLSSLNALLVKLNAKLPDPKGPDDFEVSGREPESRLEE